MVQEPDVDQDHPGQHGSNQQQPGGDQFGRPGPSGRWLDCMFSMAIAAMMKAEGLRAGVPDIMFPWANNTHNGLAIEFKSHTGRLSDEQKDYLALLDQHHWKTCVLRDAEQAWIEVFNYLRNCK